MARAPIALFFFVTMTLIISVPLQTDACTVITVGKDASTDGSVITSHTVDSHRVATDVRMVPRKKHKPGSKLTITKRVNDDSGKMQRHKRRKVGEIDQVPVTNKYLAPAYAPMNEFQVALGESTFGGREELKSDIGLIDLETIQALMMQRARSAREAIRVAGDLVDTHGWIDDGEALSVVDENEAWIMEIVGPGKGKKGAVWAAKRVPDGHVSVMANAARIMELNLEDKDNYMASANVVTVAVESGYFDPAAGVPFRFAYAYNPTGRTAFVSTRREWRVFSLLAPSLGLDPGSNDFPFSIKPDEKVSVGRIMEIFRDTYEGTPFDVTDRFTVTDEKTKKTVKSPLANPFMPYDANKLFKINGGWGWRGERTIARWYTMYTVITQSRSWMPDKIGGVVWFGYDNNATTTFVPIHMAVTELPEAYRTDGRTTGFSRKSAWWAFNRVATLAAHRWGEAKKDVAHVRDPMQQQMLTHMKVLDETGTKLHDKSPKAAAKYFNKYVRDTCATVTGAYWNLGDYLWTKYDEKW